MRISGSRRGLAIITTTVMILAVVAVIGIGALSVYNAKTMTFKQLVSSTFSTISSNVQESLVMENVAYHSNTQSFNVTMTNNGYEAVNVTKVQVQGPTTNAFNSNQTAFNIGTPTFSRNNCIIMPGQSCTAGIVYHCFSDPVTISATTSRGTNLSTKISPVIPWYSSQWQSRKEITIDNTKVSGTLTNFPVLINITDTNLKNSALQTGNDILFTACDGVTKLNHEIDNYTSPTGALTAWVNVPTLYNTPNDIIYMYYGNSGSFPQQNVAATWNSNYGGVWHFNTRSGGYAVTPDNVKTTSGLDNACQLVLNNFKVGSGQKELLLAAASVDGQSFTSVQLDQLSGVSGTPFTNAIAKLNSVDVEFWYLKSVPAGTHSITYNYNPPCKGVFGGIGAYSFFGVDQTTPIVQSKSNSGNGVLTSVPITNTYANGWLFDFTGVYNNGGLSNPVTPQVLEWNNMTGSSCGGGNPSCGSYASSKIVSSVAGTPNNFQWTAATSGNWAAVAVELNSASGYSVVPDSTSNANDLSTFTISRTDVISSPFYNGTNFDGSTKYLSRTVGLAGMPPNTNSPQTGSIWFWVSSNPGTAQDVFSFQPSLGNAAVKMGFRSSNFAVSNWAGGTLVYATPPSAGSWHYAVYTYDGATNRLYIDGTQKATSTTSPDSGIANSLYVATYSGLTEYFNGHLDETRYSNIARSAAWIATEYNNEASPSTFYIIGPQQAVTDPRSAS